MHVSYMPAEGGYLAEFSEENGRRSQTHVQLSAERVYPDLPGQSSNAGYYEVVARILSSATAPFKVLDGACGSGYGSEILVRASPREFTHEVLGVDSHEAVVEYAALRHRLASFLHSPVERLRFRDGYFDMVVDVDGLANMADPDAALTNYHRMLCDVGLLFLAVSSPDRDAVLERVFANGFEVAHEVCDNADLLFIGCIKHKKVDDLHEFWANNADESARHHCEETDGWADFIDARFGDYISAGETGTALEWGCGQGNISRKLAARVDGLHLVDILDASLEKATESLAKDNRAPASTTRVSSATDANLPIDSVDVLLCTAVVQHFPTVAYWREVASLWNSLSPDTIVLQTRHGEENRETKNYRTEYFTALWLSTDEVLSQFPNYEVAFHHCDTKEDHIWSPVTHYEFFVLKRKT